MMTMTPAQPEQPQVKTLPLAALHEAAGAAHAPACGWNQPLHFGDPEAEYKAARDSAALMDASFLTVLRATGADHLEYLNRRLSQRVLEMASGDLLRATQLNGEGRMEADLELISVGPGKSLLLAPPTVDGAYLQAIADKYVFTEDAAFEDVTDQFAAFALFGPSAPGILRDAGGAAPDQGRAVPLTVNGADGWVLRSAYLPGALVLLTTRAGAEALWTLLSRLVSAAGGRPIGFLAFDTLRVEAGTPWWGIDLTERSIPLEADLMDAIHTNKGCYPGQETVAKILNLGHPPRKLAGIEWDGEDPPAAGEKLLAEGGKDAGTLTSSTYSPRAGKAVGLAMVRWSYREPGTELQTAGGLRGRIVALPFGG